MSTIPFILIVLFPLRDFGSGILLSCHIFADSESLIHPVIESDTADHTFG